MSSTPLPAPIRTLKAAGQQVWLDDLSRALVRSGGLFRAIEEWGVTGVTSNPAIVARAVLGDSGYDLTIARCADRGMDAEGIALELAVEDVSAAADLLCSTWIETDGGDGWVSIQLSPRLANDATGSLEAALALHQRVGRPNVLIKMPATKTGLAAIEEVLVRGVPVTVTLLLTPAHVALAAEAYLRALERRAASGESLDVRSYAALYVSRWDQDCPTGGADRKGTLGIAVADAALAAHGSVFSGEGWRALAERGARPQTLLFASTLSRDPALGAAYYVERLVAKGTANTVPPAALEAFATEGVVQRPLSGDLHDPGAPVRGIEINVRGDELQSQAALGFATAWEDLLDELERRTGPTLR
jgi:transaldolase